VGVVAHESGRRRWGGGCGLIKTEEDAAHTFAEESRVYPAGDDALWAEGGHSFPQAGRQATGGHVSTHHARSTCGPLDSHEGADRNLGVTVNSTEAEPGFLTGPKFEGGALS